MDSPWILIAFLSVFHLLGGAAVGVALWELRVAGKPNTMLLVWGLLFGGLPMAAGAGWPVILPFQLGEFLLAGGTTFFFWDRIRDLVSQTGVVVTLFGGVFFLVGCGAVSMLLGQREFLMAIVFGVSFGGVGLAGLVYGLKRTLNPPADEDEG
jgi:hypothetical protein